MSKGMKIAIGIILALAVIACAFFLYRSILADTNNTPGPSETPIPLPTLAPAPATTAPAATVAPDGGTQATQQPVATDNGGTTFDGT